MRWLLSINRGRVLRNRVSRVAHGFAADVLGTFGTRAILVLVGLLTSVLLARALGPVGKGQYTLSLLVVGLALQMGSLGIGFSTVYHIGRNANHQSQVASNSLVLSVVLGLVAMGVGFLLAWNQQFRLAFLKDVEWIWLAIPLAVIPLGMVAGTLDRVLTGLNRFLESNAVALSAGTIQLGLLALLLLTWRMGVLGAVVAYALVTVASFFLGALVLAKVVGIKFAPTLAFSGALLGFGLKGHIGNLIQFANYRVDMFLVAYFTGAFEVGLYSIAVLLAEKLWLLPGSIATVLYSRVSSFEGESTKGLSAGACRHALLFALAGAMVFLLAGHYIIQILFGAQFLPALMPLWLLLPGAVGMGVTKVLTNDITGRGFPLVNTAGAAISFAVTLPLVVLLIPKYGISGAALASTASYLTLLGWTLSWYVRITGVSASQVLLPRRSDLGDYAILWRRGLDKLGIRHWRALGSDTNGDV